MAYATEIIKGKKYKLWANVGTLPNGERERRTKVVEASGKKEAREMAKAFEDDLKERMELDEEMFFVKFVKKWEDNYAEVELEESTQENYQLSLKFIVSFFENYRMKQIKPLNIVDFFNKERKEGRASLGIKYKVLQSIFKHAVKWGIIKDEDNPMNEQDKPKSSKKQENKDFYRSHEIPVMLSFLKEYSLTHQAIVLLALTGALRRGEIAGLATDVLNFKNNSTLVKRSLQQSKKEGLKLKSTKTEDTRTVILPSKVMEMLHTIYLQKLNLKMELGPLWHNVTDINGKEVILLFSNEVGKPYRPDSITQFWNRFAIKHEDDLRRIRFHDLRHSSATYILNEGTKKGMNMRTVQKRLGHKNIKTTLNLYSHVTEQEDLAAGELFDDILL